ncbi:hypothetical protein AAHN93_03460 [Vandammella animalimorsus]|uniref:hypothetical protein n=1 Tax=Vandammella animalimorsus TaxID=2029117 RepID=UPI0031BA38D4
MTNEARHDGDAVRLMRLKRMVPMLAAAAALAGCLGEEIPKCDAPSALQRVEGMLNETFAQNAFGKELQAGVRYELRQVRQIEHHSSGRYTCQAMVTMRGKESQKAYEADIFYTILARGSGFEVSVNGLDAVVLGAARAKGQGIL